MEPAPDLYQLPIVQRLDQHPGQRRVPGRPGIAGEEEGAAAVVQEPLCLHTSLEGSVRKPIRLKMIRLSVIHWH